MKELAFINGRRAVEAKQRGEEEEQGMNSRPPARKGIPISWWSCFKISAGVMMCLAVSLKVFPAYCFKVPWIGWFCHMAITGKLPPAYVRMDCYELNEMKEWARDGDAVVTTLAKSGTTWMLYLSHLIRVRGDVAEEFPYVDINVNSLWPAFVHKPGQSWAEMKLLMYSTVLHEGIPLRQLWDNPQYIFRVWKAHESPLDPAYPAYMGAILPVAEFPNVKFLAMGRDLVDVCASLFHFVASHSKEFKSLWGGFPPSFSSPRQMIDLLFKGPDKTRLLGYSFLHYIANWHAHAWRNNVLLLHYNDALRDLPRTVRTISAFYGVNLTEYEVATVAAKSSLGSMRAMRGKFNYRLWGHPTLNEGRAACMEEGKIIRNGVSGGSGVFSPDERKELRLYQEEYFRGRPALLAWARDGGELPP